MQRAKRKGKVRNRRLRREERVPGILYGANQPAQSLVFMQSELQKVLQHEAFTRTLSLCTLMVIDKKQF